MPGEFHVVLGVSGSIAAYKAADIVRLMTGRGWRVSVMMTQSATRYVGPLTFQALTGRMVAHGRFEDLPDSVFAHIDLAQDTSAILLAPATANLIAKIAHGLADDIVTATVLARSVPLIVAPAMNDQMWSNAATQDNLALLRARGVHVLDVEHGELACGRVGAGRLAPPERIVEATARILDAAEPV